jgi:hypothetical protein
LADRQDGLLAGKPNARTRSTITPVDADPKIARKGTLPEELLDLPIKADQRK